MIQGLTRQTPWSGGEQENGREPASMGKGSDTGHPNSIVPLKRVQQLIIVLRGQSVMLDADLALLYGVETRALIQAVKRHTKRFPDDFMFQVTQEEFDSMRSQIVISKGRGSRRYLPYAFTEQGVAMLSSVLNSDRAIEVNVAIMRAFVHLRRMIGSHEELARKLAELEARLAQRVLLLLHALCSMLHARPKALIGRRGR